MRTQSFRDGEVIKTLGYYEKFDGGGNEFFYHSSKKVGDDLKFDGGFFVEGSGPTSYDYFEAIDKTVVNVRQFGAKGDASTDDTEALQRAANSWKKRNGLSGRLHFPRGKYNISSTINLGGNKAVGNLVTADGTNTDNFQVNHQNNVIHGGAAIVWIGKTPKPMITYNSAGLIWDGPVLWGKYSDATNDRATTAFEVTKGSARGQIIGTGQMHFKQLQVANVGIALHANGEVNVDQFQVDRFQIRSVTTGFRSESSQNTGNLFGYVTAQDVGDVFDFAVLAHTSVQSFVANLRVGAFVKCHDASSASGQFICHSMKVDGKGSVAANDQIMLVKTPTYISHGTFVFNGITSPYPLKMKLIGEITVLVRNSQGVVGSQILDLETANNDSRNLVVEYQNCFVRNVTPKSTISSSSGSQTVVVFRDCLGVNNILLPSRKSVNNRVPVDADDFS